MVILGLDIGGTKTAVVVGNERGAVLHRRQFPTVPARGFAVVYSELTTQMRSVLEAPGCGVEVISVSIGGPLDVLNGIINSPPHLPGWDEIPLKEKLEAEFHLPVLVEHDGNAGALAEWHFGAGRGFTNIVFLTMGTGLGAGLILDGRIYRGTTDTAGELGHIRIAETGPYCYGKAGSLEGYGSGTGIAHIARTMYPALWGNHARVEDVHAHFERGSTEARDVFEHAGFHFGRGLAMIADMLNPQRIILGGIGMRLGEALLAPARAAFVAEALPVAARACEILPAQLGEAIGDIASLCAAIDRFRST